MILTPSLLLTITTELQRDPGVQREWEPRCVLHTGLRRRGTHDGHGGGHRGASPQEQHKPPQSGTLPVLFVPAD